MVVNGDDTQIDLPRGHAQRLARRRARSSPEIDDVGIVRLDETDVVRHPLVGRIVAAYDRLSREREASAVDLPR